MQLFRFGRATAHPIDSYNSVNSRVIPLAHLGAECHVNCIYLEAGGAVGLHPAVENQLFLVVEGEGEVLGESGEWVAILKSEGAFWRAGEAHESRTDSGMTAIAIEGKGIAPSTVLPRSI